MEVDVAPRPARYEPELLRAATLQSLTDGLGPLARPSCGSRCSCGWSGGLLSSVGVADLQCAVGLEGELPVFVVDGMVVTHTQRQQIVDVGQSVVAPPDDVVQFAQIETGRTAGDRTRRIDGP